MNPQRPAKYSLAYKWLSYCLAAGFIYYWLFTMFFLFFNKTVYQVTPKQAGLYQAFCKQTWRLFAYSTFYNREVELVVRDKTNPAVTDTVHLVQFSIARKRKAAPFNDFYDGFDQLLYWMLNDMETQLVREQKKLKEQFPGKQDSFYMRQSNALVIADSVQRQPLQNLENYGRYVMRELQKDTTGKEFQLVLVHKFIPPAKPAAGSVATGNLQTLFISSFKSF